MRSDKLSYTAIQHPLRTQRLHGESLRPRHLKEKRLNAISFFGLHRRCFGYPVGDLLSKLSGLVAFCLCLSGLASASENSGSCVGLGSLGFDEQLKAGHVVGAGPAYLQSWLKDCETDPNDCRTSGQSYLVMGDSIVVVGSIRGFFCVEYSKNGLSKRRYMGWIPADRIEVASSTEVTYPLTAWLGTWTSGSTSKIIIRADGNALRAEGNALWQGPISPTPHFGDFDEVATPQGNLTILGGVGNDCRVQLLLMGKVLVAMDNLRCGGGNVSFSGFYVRKP
jgi:hypothetical protein